MTGPDADEVARANVRAWELLVDAVPGAWVRRDGGAVALVTGAELGGFNGVWGEASDPDPAAVARLLDAVGAQGVPHCMQLRPGWAPEVDAIARERGLVRVPGEPLMVLVDDRRLAGALEVDGLALRQVTPDEAGLHARVAAEGEVTRQEAAYRRVISPEVLATPGVRCYVGEARGKAVTTALSVTAADCAGIFSVATVPGARRRGYGAAVTARAVGDALRDGARWAWLSASDDGYPVYRRLGFATLERLDFWEPLRG
jgi:GNAT superfamily N-acetyltransferase